MKLNKIPKSELELLPYTEIAKMYLEETKKTMNTADLFKEVCSLLELDENDYVNLIADFFQSLTTSKEFILLEDGTWDLRSRHTSDKIGKITDEEEEEEENDSDQVDQEEEIEEDEYEDTDEEYDEDTSEELKDLVVIDEDELELEQ